MSGTNGLVGFVLRAKWVWLAVCLVLSACQGAASPAVAETPTVDVSRAPERGPSNGVTEDQQIAVAPVELGPIPVTVEDPSWGAADAPVTIVEFGDLQCPFCERVQDTLSKIRNTYGNRQVRMVWKNNPLPFHEQARPAQLAAMAVHRAAGNDAFWYFVGRAYANRDELTQANYEMWAAEAGVEAEHFNAALGDGRGELKLNADAALAEELGVTGVPAFRINGVEVTGAQPFEEFEAVIDEQLAAARTLMDKGVARDRVSVQLTIENHAVPREPEAEPEAEPEDTTAWRVPVLADDPTLGPSDALVTIVQWADYQCPFCKRVLPTLRQLRDAYGGDLRIVWKDNPLDFHDNARRAANLARHVYALRGNDGYWKVHDALFEKQANLDDATLEDIVRDMKMSWPLAKAAIDKGKYDDRIGTDQELAMDLAARGTPNFFINGRRLNGAQPFEQFAALVDQQLSEAKALVEQGVPRSQVYAKLMAAAQAPPEPEQRAALTSTRARPSKGPANARVTVRIFSDFQCPYCQRVLPILDALAKRHPGQVRFEYWHMPLPFHKDAQLAAEASAEVFAQKGNAAFWRFHDLLFANQKAIGPDDLRQYARQVGVELARFDQALADGRHKKAVEADFDAASDRNIRGTPSFMVNEYFISGAQPVERFDKLVKLALSKSQGKQ